MIDRRLLLGGLVSLPVAASAQTFRAGRAPGFRSGLRFLGAASPTSYSTGFDGFGTGTLPPGWINAAGTWVVQASANAISSPNGLINSANSDMALYGGLSKADCTVLVGDRYKSGNAALMSPGLRFDNAYTVGYIAILNISASTALIYVRQSGSYTEIARASFTTSQIPLLADGDIIRQELSAVGSTISFRAWAESKGQSRPSTPFVSVTDTTKTAAGFGGIYATSSTPYPADDFSIA